MDFGKMGPMLDPVTNRVRVLWALVVTLSFSRYQFVWPTFARTTEAVCEGLDRAWWFFGAMIRTMIYDYVSRHVIGIERSRSAAALLPTEMLRMATRIAQ